MQVARMDNENDMVVKRLSVPMGLEELMESLTKEVLRRKPSDIYAFASEHFAQLLEIRDQGKYRGSVRRIRKTYSQASNDSFEKDKRTNPVKAKSATFGAMTRSTKTRTQTLINKGFTPRRNVAPKVETKISPRTLDNNNINLTKQEKYKALSDKRKNRKSIDENKKKIELNKQPVELETRKIGEIQKKGDRRKSVDHRGPRMSIHQMKADEKEAVDKTRSRSTSLHQMKIDEKESTTSNKSRSRSTSKDSGKTEKSTKKSDKSRSIRKSEESIKSRKASITEESANVAKSTIKAEKLKASAAIISKNVMPSAVDISDRVMTQMEKQSSALPENKEAITEIVEDKPSSNDVSIADDNKSLQNSVSENSNEDPDKFSAEKIDLIISNIDKMEGDKGSVITGTIAEVGDEMGNDKGVSDKKDVSLDMIKAVIKIQSVVRGFLGRKAGNRRRISSDTLDSNNLFKKSINKEIDMTRAAIIIQSLIKGYLVRKNLKKVNDSKGIPQNVEIRNSSVDEVVSEVKIKENYNQISDLDENQGKKVDVQEIENKMKDKGIDEVDGKVPFGDDVMVKGIPMEELADSPNSMKMAATLIQSAWRGHRLRKSTKVPEIREFQKPTECDELPYQRFGPEETKKAATIIQAIFRGYLSRKHHETSGRRGIRMLSFEEKLPTLLEVDETSLSSSQNESNRSISEKNSDVVNVSKLTSETVSSLKSKAISDEEVFEILKELDDAPIPTEVPRRRSKTYSRSLTMDDPSLHQISQLRKSNTFVMGDEFQTFEKDAISSQTSEKTDLEESLISIESDSSKFEDAESDLAEITTSIKEDVHKLKEALESGVEIKDSAKNDSDKDQNIVDITRSISDDVKQLEKTLSQDANELQRAANVSENIANSVEIDDLVRPLSKDSITSTDSVDTVIFNDKHGKEPLSEAESVETVIEASIDDIAGKGLEIEKLEDVKERSDVLVDDVLNTAATKIQNFFRVIKSRSKSSSEDRIPEKSISQSTTSDELRQLWQEEAATTIQKNYKGYRVRRDLESQKEKVLIDQKEKERLVDKELTHYLKQITEPIRRAFSADKTENKDPIQIKKRAHSADTATPNVIYIPLRDYSDEDKEVLKDIPEVNTPLPDQPEEILIEKAVTKELNESKSEQMESHQSIDEKQDVLVEGNINVDEKISGYIGTIVEPLKKAFKSDNESIEVTSIKEMQPTEVLYQYIPLRSYSEDEPAKAVITTLDDNVMTSMSILAEESDDTKSEKTLSNLDVEIAPILKESIDVEDNVEESKKDTENIEKQEGHGSKEISEFISSIVEPVKQTFSPYKHEEKPAQNVIKPSQEEETVYKYIPLRDYSTEDGNQNNEVNLNLENQQNSNQEGRSGAFLENGAQKLLEILPMEEDKDAILAAGQENKYLEENKNATEEETQKSDNSESAFLGNPVLEDHELRIVVGENKIAEDVAQSKNEEIVKIVTNLNQEISDESKIDDNKQTEIIENIDETLDDISELSQNLKSEGDVQLKNQDENIVEDINMEEIKQAIIADINAVEKNEILSKDDNSLNVTKDSKELNKNDSKIDTSEANNLIETSQNDSIILSEGPENKTQINETETDLTDSKTPQPKSKESSIDQSDTKNSISSVDRNSIDDTSASISVSETSRPLQNITKIEIKDKPADQTGIIEENVVESTKIPEDLLIKNEENKEKNDIEGKMDSGEEIKQLKLSVIDEKESELEEISADIDKNDSKKEINEEIIKVEATKGSKNKDVDHPDAKEEDIDKESIEVVAETLDNSADKHNVEIVEMSNNKSSEIPSDQPKLTSSTEDKALDQTIEVKNEIKDDTSEIKEHKVEIKCIDNLEKEGEATIELSFEKVTSNDQDENEESKIPEKEVEIIKGTDDGRENVDIEIGDKFNTNIIVVEPLDNDVEQNKTKDNNQKDRESEKSDLQATKTILLTSEVESKQLETNNDEDIIEDEVFKARIDDIESQIEDVLDKISNAGSIEATESSKKDKIEAITELDGKIVNSEGIKLDNKSEIADVAIEKNTDANLESSVKAEQENDENKDNSVISESSIKEESINDHIAENDSSISEFSPKENLEGGGIKENDIAVSEESETDTNKVLESIDSKGNIEIDIDTTKPTLVSDMSAKAEIQNEVEKSIETRTNALNENNEAVDSSRIVPALEANIAGEILKSVEESSLNDANKSSIDDSVKDIVQNETEENDQNKKSEDIVPSVSGQEGHVEENSLNESHEVIETSATSSIKDQPDIGNKSIEGNELNEINRTTSIIDSDQDHVEAKLIEEKRLDEGRDAKEQVANVESKSIEEIGLDKDNDATEAPAIASVKEQRDHIGSKDVEEKDVNRDNEALESSTISSAEEQEVDVESKSIEENHAIDVASASSAKDEEAHVGITSTDGTGLNESKEAIESVTTHIEGGAKKSLDENGSKDSSNTVELSSTTTPAKDASDKKSENDLGQSNNALELSTVSHAKEDHIEIKSELGQSNDTAADSIENVGDVINSSAGRILKEENHIESETGKTIEEIVSKQSINAIGSPIKEKASVENESLEENTSVEKEDYNAVNESNDVESQVEKPIDSNLNDLAVNNAPNLDSEVSKIMIESHLERSTENHPKLDQEKVTKLTQNSSVETTAQVGTDENQQSSESEKIQNDLSAPGNTNSSTNELKDVQLDVANGANVKNKQDETDNIDEMKNVKMMGDSGKDLTNSGEINKEAMKSKEGKKDISGEVSEPETLTEKVQENHVKKGIGFKNEKSVEFNDIDNERLQSQIRISDTITSKQTDKSSPFYLHQDILFQDTPSINQERKFSEALKLSTESERHVDEGIAEKLLHSSEYHDSIPVDLSTEEVPEKPLKTQTNGVQCNMERERTMPTSTVLVHSGELHDNILPLALQMNQDPGQVFVIIQVLRS